MVHPDPLSRESFGAGPEEMVLIANYRRALADQKKRQANGKELEPDEGEDGERKPGKGGGKQKK